MSFAVCSWDGCDAEFEYEIDDRGIALVASHEQGRIWAGWGELVLEQPRPRRFRAIFASLCPKHVETVMRLLKPLPAI